MPKLRNINPLGYVDLPLIGRVGPAPFLVCHAPHECHSEHEHTEVVDEDGAGSSGVGCLIPGEVFEVSAEHFKVLAEQTENYEVVKTAAKKTAKKAPGKPAPENEPDPALDTDEKKG